MKKVTINGETHRNYGRTTEKQLKMWLLHPKIVNRQSPVLPKWSIHKFFWNKKKTNKHTKKPRLPEKHQIKSSAVLYWKELAFEPTMKCLHLTLSLKFMNWILVVGVFLCYKQVWNKLESKRDFTHLLFNRRLYIIQILGTTRPSFNFSYTDSRALIGLIYCQIILLKFCSSIIS